MWRVSEAGQDHELIGCGNSCIFMVELETNFDTNLIDFLNEEAVLCQFYRFKFYKIAFTFLMLIDSQ